MKLILTRRDFVAWTGAAIGASFTPIFPAEASDVAPQPYFAEVKRALEAMEKLGSPVSVADAQRITALAQKNDSSAVDEAENILDHYTLARLSIDANGSASISKGGAQRVLVEQGWRMFLVRLANPGGLSQSINFSTGARLSWYFGGPGHMMPYFSSLSQRPYLLDTLNKAPLIEKMWLLSELYGTTPVVFRNVGIQAVPLSGFAVEYHVIQLLSRDSGRREASLILTSFSKTNEGSGYSVPSYSVGRKFDFDCLPSRLVTVGVQDTDGRGCVASLTIRDKLQHVYPAQAMRLAPDLFFQPQIYRGDGEIMRLPDGEYTVESWRGPEYLKEQQTVEISENHARIDVRLKRWIDPSHWGWYSGDTHIHAGGCAHYEIPTEGVSPETMIRQARGEGLSIGDVLSWGPSWYYQKQFFKGYAESPAAALEHPELQAANNTSLQPHGTTKDLESTLRYDVEVSGFPSSHAGHLVLLRLKEQDYPGTKLIEDWPSWNLPILRWARAQGAVAGYAHCGAGMVVDSTDLPNYEIPPMDDTGTQEGIIDVTHGFVDFLSGCDTMPVAELNAWYHMLNCGFRMAMLGETDYPCIYGERPGVGRSYVLLDHRPEGNEGYEAWIRGIQQGRLYCGDGRSHFLEFTVNDRRSGDRDLAFDGAATVNIEALVAARLEPQAPTNRQAIRRTLGNRWHLEFARLEATRDVPVELIVNGVAMEKIRLVADGTPQSIQFRTVITHSSWISLRIFPSSHSHPIFIKVSERPIRASKRSAEWCRACVDKVWEVKSAFIRKSEQPAAQEAFDHARKTYETVASECEVV